MCVTLVGMSGEVRMSSHLTRAAVKAVAIVALLLTPSTVALLGSPRRTEAAQPSLTSKWTVRLGATNASGIYRLAPCADGDVYLSDASGRLVLLNRDGSLLSDTPVHKELSGAAAIACDSGDRLIAVADSLLVLTRSGSAASLSAKISLPKTAPYAHRLAIAGNGTFYFTGTRDGKAFIHQMDTQGNLLRSFGTPPSASRPYLSRLAGVRGALVWDATRQRLLYIPSNPFEIRIYDQDGTLTAVKPQADAGLKPPRVDPESGAPLPSDEVMGAAMIPGNRLVVQVLKGQPTPTGGYHRIPYLYVFDADLNPVAVIRQTDPAGVLQGAASDGTLYFAWITLKTGIQVVAQSLVDIP